MTTGRINQVPTVLTGRARRRAPGLPPADGGRMRHGGRGLVTPRPQGSPGRRAARRGDLEAIPITPSELPKGASARRDRCAVAGGLRHGALGEGLPATRGFPPRGARGSRGTPDMPAGPVALAANRPRTPSVPGLPRGFKRTTGGPTAAPPHSRVPGRVGRSGYGGP